MMMMSAPSAEREDEAALERMRAAAEDFSSDIPSFQEAGDFASLARGLGAHQRVAETACAALDALTALCSATTRAEVAKLAVANVVSCALHPIFFLVVLSCAWREVPLTSRPHTAGCCDGPAH